jgi:hypothetical protein
VPITLTNAGNLPFTISGVSITGEFAQSNTCGASVAPGTSCTLDVTFHPDQTGDRTGSLTITDGVSGSPHVIALTGSGTDFAIEPAPRGSTSETATVGANGNLTAFYHLQVAAIHRFSGPLTLTCSGAPPGTDCKVLPDALTAAGSTVPFTILVETSDALALATGTLSPPRWMPVAVAFAALGLAALGLAWLRHGAGRSLRRRRLLVVLTFALVVIPALSFSGCDGTARMFDTPPGMYELTVTGTSHGQSRALSLTLKVD